MPDADAVRSTIDSYLALFSAREREAWLDLFADEATMEDPVGTPLKRGREEIGAFFDQSHGSADSVELIADGPAVVIGSEAAFAFRVRPVLGGSPFELRAVDVMTFDDEARIVSQRAFVDFAMLAPMEA